MIGLDFPAVFEIAERLGIEDTPGLILRIKALESAELSRANKSENASDA